MNGPLKPLVGALSLLIPLVAGMPNAWSAELHAPSLLKPGHLRAEELPPKAWRDVFAPERPLALFWDGDLRHAVEVRRPEGWRMIAESAGSGWNTPSLPRGAELRLVGSDGALSEVFHAQSVVKPSDVARLGQKEPSLLGQDVVDIELDPKGAPWVASLGGGLALLERQSLVAQTYTRSDGLPSDRVVAVATGKDVVWAGTAGGLARLEAYPDQGDRKPGDKQYRVTGLIDLADGLPDSYVQALAMDGARLWIGTYHGLAVLEDGRLRTVLEPWSVFSLLRGTDGRIWAGYEGLRGLPDAEPIEGVPFDLDVYDVEVLPEKGTLLATLQEGLVQLHEGQRTSIWEGNGADGAYAIARVGEKWLAAGGEGGLVTIDAKGEIEHRWSKADGLQSLVVNEVIPDVVPDSGPDAPQTSAAWLGTDRGASYWNQSENTLLPAVISDYPAGRVPATAARRGGRIWVADQDGLKIFGARRLLDSRRERSAGAGLIGSFRLGLDRWWVYDDHVEQRRLLGVDRVFPLPWPATVATLHDGTLWVGGSGGALRYSRQAANMLPVSSLGPVKRLRSGRNGILWAIASDTVVAVDAELGARPYVRTKRPMDISPDGDIVWVGTVRGIEALQPETGDVIDVLKTADNGVRIPALAADGRGGVWAATDSGTVLHLATGGKEVGATIFDLDPAEPPAIHEIVPMGSEGAWVLTNQGFYAVTRPSGP